MDTCLARCEIVEHGHSRSWESAIREAIVNVKKGADKLEASLSDLLFFGEWNGSDSDRLCNFDMSAELELVDHAEKDDDADEEGDEEGNVDEMDLDKDGDEEGNGDEMDLDKDGDEEGNGDEMDLDKDRDEELDVEMSDV
jgi:hypothetical protein